MTVTSSLACGWNPPKLTGEPGLHIYVAKDGSKTAYYKGRVNGVMASIKLDGDTLTEWKKQVRVLRGDDDKAEAAAGSRSVKVGAYASSAFLQRQRGRVGHPNPKLRRSRRSVENDAQRIRDFIENTPLGGMKFGDVKVKHVRVWLEHLYALRKANGQSYAQGTLGDIVRILGAVFREARKDGLLTRNLVRELEVDEKPRRTPQTEKRYMTQEQVDALTRELGPAFHPVVFLCAWVGLRISEALGLVWDNLDLDLGTITIERQLDSDTKERGRVDTKTENSKATLDLLPEVVELLQAHKLAMAKRGLQYVRDDALVFVTATGKPQSRRNALRALHNAGDKLGFNVDEHGKPMKKVDLHSLRHSLISNGIDSGMTFTEMALLARHDERTTVAMYAKVPEQKRRDAAAKLAERLGRTGR